MKHTENRLRDYPIRLLVAIALLGIILSACTSGTSTSAPEAAVEDTATPQPPDTAAPIPPKAETESPIDLDGTYWTLVSYIDDQGNTVSVLPDAGIDAEFTAGQTVGTAGCNRYFTDYQVDDDSLTLGPVGATRMACGETIDNQEMQYLTALGSAAAYDVKGDQLQIVDAEGATVLTFAKAEAVEDAPGAQAWTVDLLKNVVYTIDDLGEVQLVDGNYENQYGDGATMVDTVAIVNVALGDLDGDSNDDAAVTLAWQSGGSGTFLYLVVMRNDAGTPRQAGILALGDRVQPGEFNITDGSIVLDVLTHGPDDPMCCPSQKVLQTYALVDDALTLMSSETAGLELIGAVWTWARFDDTAGKNNIVVDDPSRYTLEFLADGTYRLQADCNQGSGGYTLNGSSLVLEPGPMTMVECEPGSLYDDYVTRLGDVVTYIFDGDTLILNLKMDAGNMVFTQSQNSGAGLGMAPDRVSPDA